MMENGFGSKLVLCHSAIPKQPRTVQPTVNFFSGRGHCINKVTVKSVLEANMQRQD